ncbi:MAG: deoxyribose-phosphate aldolase [Acidobacteria bacterium]|nr:deoxyribose-phosphate aldolase [Acidobacteriota bacterium]
MPNDEAIPAPDLAAYIDHTLLRPEAPPAAMERLAAEAAEHGFASVCLPPVHVAAAARALAGTAVRTGTVVAFPFGYVQPEIRIAESRRAIQDGAQELDTVMNLSWFAGGEEQRVLDDLAAWVAAARAERSGLTLKVILETALWSPDQKVRAARLAVAAGADFVKTSTGFYAPPPAATAGSAIAGASAVRPASGGATVEDVALLVRTVGSAIGVKASGGIRDAAGARALIAAGARRLGTSSGLAIIGAASGGARQASR